MRTQEADESATSDTVQPADRFDRRFLGILTAVGVLSLWVRPASSSLWVDELGTWWVVKDSFSDTIHRAWEFQGESPLYYAILWADRHLLGTSELALRAPSIAATAGAACFMYLLGRRLLDKEFAQLAVLMFVISMQISFQAIDARPYALGILGVVGSTYFLVRWLDTGAVRFGLGAVLMAALTAYAHYLLCLVWIPQAVYALARAKDGSSRARWRDLLIGAAATLLLIAPLIAQLGSLWTRRTSLTLGGTTSIEWFAGMALPAAVVAGLLVGAVLACITGASTFRLQPLRERGALLILGSLLIPLGVLASISVVSSLSFSPIRYALSATPAAVLLVAWIVRSFEPARARRIVAAVLTIAAVVDFGGPTLTPEDWRDAAAAERSIATPRTALLLHPVLVESAQLDWFDDAERRSYLLAPSTYYPMSGQLLPVPYVADEASKAFLQKELESQLASVDRILYMTRDRNVPFPDWLDGYLGSRGWTMRTVGTFGSVVLIEFTRG
jgi:mannosyltransferase